MLGVRADALILATLIAACVQEERPVTVSLEEAREIALELVESEFETPPRSIADLVIPSELNVHNLENISCSTAFFESIEHDQKRRGVI